ncbi:glycosyltransferase family 4 protein [Tistrella bauzanensis]
MPEAAGPGFSVATPDDDPIDRAMITVAEPFVMMVASVLPHKSPRMVVDAAATLWHGAGIRTVILGTDPRGALAQTLTAAGNTGIVCLYGVPTPVLAAYYRRALCLVMPSEYEGFGLPILEAQTSGCPVITTRRGALPEVAGDAAIFVEPGNAAAMADAVLGLYRDTAARAALVARGLPNAARFSWERAAERTAAIFDDCLARRSQGVARRPAGSRVL